MTMLMGLNSSGTWFCTFWATFCTTLQLVASTVITSRFIFALARDKGIPFSKFLVRTDKHKEPWVAMAALLLSLFASVIGVVVKPQKNYTSLLQAFHFYFISIPYVSLAKRRAALTRRRSHSSSISYLASISASSVVPSSPLASGAGLSLALPSYGWYFL